MLIRRGETIPVPEVAGIEHPDRLRRLGYEPMPESWTRAPEDGWFIYGLDEEGRPVRYWQPASTCSMCWKPVPEKKLVFLEEWGRVCPECAAHFCER